MLVNVYAHPTTCMYETDPEIIRFSEGSRSNGVCIFLSGLPEPTKEILRSLRKDVDKPAQNVV